MLTVDPRVTPASPRDAQPTIGLIGMGAMGRMYAKYLSNAGWLKIHVCDRSSNYETLKNEFAGTPGITPLVDGHAVARSSDFLMYSVEAEFIERVVKEYGPSTKLNAIVAGQTSVKAPEKAAFEKYLPEDTYIVSCHSLHGPTVNPTGQPLVLIQHRAPPEALTLVESIFSAFNSRYVYLSYEEHDLVTANTQAVTHAAFLSMGTAWCSSMSYPWTQGLYIGGIETAKVNITVRIYSNAWHVYAGLAILNPSAKTQIDQYAKSATELFKLMLAGGNGKKEAEKELRRRIEWGRGVVFGDGLGNDDDAGTSKTKKKSKRRPILLSQELLDRFSIGTLASTDLDSSAPPSPVDTRATPPTKYRANSHLSLLAMVDCWAHLGINPYRHLALAATPIFRLFLGVAEHLFLAPASPSSHILHSTDSTAPSLLSLSLHSALHDTWHRADDLEFIIAARGWAQCVAFGSFELYKRRFEETRGFFEGMFAEAKVKGSEMIEAIMETEVKREEEERDEEET